MIRNNEHRFLAQSQPLCLHSRSGHLEGLAGTYLVGPVSYTHLDVYKRQIQQFMEETFEPPFYLRRNIEVKFSPMTAEWQITGKSTPCLLYTSQQRQEAKENGLPFMEKGEMNDGKN